MRASSAINQYRVHAGYHDPWSPEPVQETLEARAEFIQGAKEAVYVGSQFTIRVVEGNPFGDSRILHVEEDAPGEIHIFSGKVVSAVKAARLVCERIAGNG